MYDRFSDAARAAVARAEAEAYARGTHHVEPEDMVVALSASSGVAGSVLRAVAAEPALLREGVTALTGPLDVDPHRARPLPLAPATASAFTIAAREADGLRVAFIGTEHLLLGLLREPAGRTTALLLAVRRDPGLIRERILDLVSSPGFVSPEAPMAAAAIVPAVVAAPEPTMTLGAYDRDLLETLLDEVARLRAEIALLRAEITGLESREDRNIA